MGSTLIFQFLYINVLNYRYFHYDCSTFLKIKKKRWKNKKITLKTRSYRKIKKTFINVYYNYAQLNITALIFAIANLGL